MRRSAVAGEYSYCGAIVASRVRFEKTEVAVSKVTATIGTETHAFEFRTTKTCQGYTLGVDPLGEALTPADLDEPRPRPHPGHVRAEVRPTGRRPVHAA